MKNLKPIHMVWYRGIQFRASSDIGLEVLSPDGVWKLVRPAPKQDQYKIEWFKMRLNPVNSKD